MPVHPVFREMIDQAGPQRAANATPLTIQEQRKAADGMVAGLTALSEEGPELAEVRDRVVPGPHGEFPVRVYTPEGTGPFPVYVYFHGGGWCMGNIAMTDGECRHVARGAACVVVSIEYHLAPENKFPIPLEDCYAATTWVVEHAAELAVDPERVAVGGGSSGGNLAAGVALMARDRGEPKLVLQVLDVPAIDSRMKTRSMEENAEGYMLTKEATVLGLLPLRIGRREECLRLAGLCRRPNRAAPGLGADSRIRPPAGRGGGVRSASSGRRSARDRLPLRRNDSRLHLLYEARAGREGGARRGDWSAPRSVHTRSVTAEEPLLCSTRAEGCQRLHSHTRLLNTSNTFTAECYTGGLFRCQLVLCWYA